MLESMHEEELKLIMREKFSRSIIGIFLLSRESSLET